MLRKIYDAVIAENDLVSRGTALVKGAATFQSDVTMEQNAAVQGNQTVDGDIVIEDSAAGESFTFRLDTTPTPSELKVIDDAGSVAQRIPVGDDLAALLADGGVHELNVQGLAGVLQDRQDPQNHGTRHQQGAEDELAVDELGAVSNDDTLVFAPDGGGGVQTVEPTSGATTNEKALIYGNI